ncbi:Cell division protein DedD [BD1-7 clade bacterium]|uniref:Cell division protein DedD n=1 Tax=BD1-7 clade bacterium TaxID=2029982 RepID=A0A5S9PSC9_9GAMM|nr:Cell division protein DedD [BD1-7 clade bacterium]
MSDHESLKYRVVGALVVIVSLALAWSILLEHDVQREHDWAKSDIPEPMQIERFDVPDVEPIEDIKPSVLTKVTVPETAKSPTDATQKTSKTSLSESAPKSKPKPVVPEKDFTQLNAQGLPEAWVLQVGSFKARENAIALQSKLRKDDLPAYVKAFKLNDGVKYRVLVGPKIDKKKAKRIAEQIRQKHKLKPMIMMFKPGYAE